MFVYPFCAVPCRMGNGFSISYRRSRKEDEFSIWNQDDYRVLPLLRAVSASRWREHGTVLCLRTGIPYEGGSVRAVAVSASHSPARHSGVARRRKTEASRRVSVGSAYTVVSLRARMGTASLVPCISGGHSHVETQNVILGLCRIKRQV